MNPHNFKTVAFIRPSMDGPTIDSFLCVPWPTPEELQVWEATHALQYPDLKFVAGAYLSAHGYAEAAETCQRYRAMQNRGRINLCEEVILNTPYPIDEDAVLAYFNEKRRRKP